MKWTLRGGKWKARRISSHSAFHTPDYSPTGVRTRLSSPHPVPLWQVSAAARWGKVKSWGCMFLPDRGENGVAVRAGQKHGKANVNSECGDTNWLGWCFTSWPGRWEKVPFPCFEKRACASKYNLATLQARKTTWRISEEHFSYGISVLVQTANVIFAQEKGACEAKEEAV